MKNKKKEYLTFDDLNFEVHPLKISMLEAETKLPDFPFEKGHTDWHTTQEIAQLNFDNGYGISVLFGTAFYSNGIDNYEVAVLKDGVLNYETSITHDVLGYQTKEQVTEVMKKLQDL